MRGTLKHIVKALLIAAACMAAPMSTAMSEETVPDITYKSSTSSPYSSAQLEYTTAGTYTWTVPDGVNEVKATLVGGGGNPRALWMRAGNNGGATHVISGGGGEIVENFLLKVTPGQILTISVGGAEEKSLISINDEVIISANFGVGYTGDVINIDQLGLAGGPGGGTGGNYITLSGISVQATDGKYGPQGATFNAPSVFHDGVPTYNSVVFHGGGGSWGRGGSDGISPTIGGGGSPKTENGSVNLGYDSIPSGYLGADGAIFINYGSTSVATTGISLNQTSLALNIDGSTTLTATVSPSNATDKSVTWTTSNASVATVSGGKVTAVGGGTATITATASGGQKATCTVTVSQPLTGISLPSSSLSIAAGASAQITPVFTPSNATNKKVAWTSSNSSVASVDASGNVTALKPGVTTITAKAADGGFTASCVVKVTSKTRAVFLKINPEAEPMPYYATVLYYGLADGIVQSYPGLDVTEDGIIEAPIVEPSGDFNIGVKTQNTLISGILASEAESDFTSETLNLITGDLDSDNIITGSDFTLLTQAMNYPPAVTDGLSMTGDLNRDGEVNRLDRIIFNKSILWTGEDRFLHSGFDMKESPVRIARTMSLSHANLPSRQESIIKLAQVSDNVYELSLTKDTPSINMLQISLTNEDNIMYTICPPPRTMGSLR